MVNLSTFNHMVDPKRLLDRIAHRTLELVPHSEGVLVGLSGGGGVCYVSGSGHLAEYEGTTVDLMSSLAGLALRTQQILRTSNSELDDRVDRDECRRLNVVSSVCVPLLTSSPPSQKGIPDNQWLMPLGWFALHRARNRVSLHALRPQVLRRECS